MDQTPTHLMLNEGEDEDLGDFGAQQGLNIGAASIPAIPVVNLTSLLPSGNFLRTFRFGVIDNSVLVLFALLGVSLEDYIAEKVGVPGYGVLMGATIGNAVSDAMAGIPEGGNAPLGYFTGAMLPVLPLGIALAMNKPVTGKTGTILKATSAAMLVGAFLLKNRKATA